MQSCKPSKLLAVSLKTRKDNTYKRSMNDEAFENDADWQTLLSKEGNMPVDNNKSSKILSVESPLLSLLLSSYSFKADEELCCDMNSSIFRRLTDNDEREDMMGLKRANPMYGSDDDDDCIDFPSKRQKTSGETTVLQWGERLEVDKTEGFCLMNLLQD